ncbi:MAG: hypothetical protein H6Q89_5370, partial [Myxococcaceae bacterium]|nr:hypothetical protein [Myxococcaceae bacterium]
RQALQQRQQQLQKSYGQGSGQPPQSAQRPSSGKGTGPSSKGKGEGEGGEGGEDGTGKGDGKTGQREGNNREHASRATKNAGSSHGEAEDVDLVFGGQAEIDPDRLKFQPLPQGQGGDEPGELWGLKAANPKKNSQGGAAAGSGSSATGEQAPGNRDGQLLPRNRALIQKYFDNAPRNP